MQSLSALNSRIYSQGVPVDAFEAIKKALAKIRPAPASTASTITQSSLPSPDQPGRSGEAARFVPLKLSYRSEDQKYLIKHAQHETEADKAARVKHELLNAGITAYGLLKAESRSLHKVLHPDEHIEAIVYGQHHSSSVMLVASDERIIFLDKKPMALFLDEVSYEVVSGIEFQVHTLFATLILHTPVKNYDIKYANLRCATNFARHIEAHRLKRENPDKEPELEVQTAASRPATQKPQYEPKDDMAGYYLLPLDEEERRNLMKQL